jgi:hypothetical protein
MSPFDWLNDINWDKKNLIKEDPSLEKSYNGFMVNRGLSYFPDSLFYANEMNRFPQLDKKLQYDFLLNSIAKRKRFSKWSKQENSDHLTLVKDYYKCSNAKAMEYLSILTEEQLKNLQQILSTGGRRK